MDCLDSVDVVRDVIIELCFLRGPCRAYMGSRGDCSRDSSVISWQKEQLAVRDSHGKFAVEEEVGL
jgi:hypothetical protein